jgi:arginyl-tRNA synthetase
MTFKERLEDVLAAALKAEFPDAGEVRFEITQPREKAHGDFASNLAMLAAGRLRKTPLEIARRVAGHIETPSELVGALEIKKPGFINIFISREAYLEKLKEIATFPRDEDYGFADIGRGHLVQVEFVSANPTGPLNVVSARAAAVGDALVRLLKRIGFDARSEFYVNDSGTQVEHLGRSLQARFRQELGQAAEVPAEGYPGEYLIPIARRVRELAGWADDALRQWGLLPRDVGIEKEAVADFISREAMGVEGTGEEAVAFLQQYLDFKTGLEADLRPAWAPLYVCHLSAEGLGSGAMMERLVWLDRYGSFLRSTYEYPGGNGGRQVPAAEIFLDGVGEAAGFDFTRFAVEEIVTAQRESLARFGKRPEGGLIFDTWFRETSLSDELRETLNALVANGRFVVEKEGAVWLKGGEEAEQDEWVIRRSTGQPTYFLSDIAYHVNKRRRGFERVIDIWGPDHHGHVGRMKAAMTVMSEVLSDLDVPAGWLEVLIAQQVNLIREGKRVVMSKRAGEYITLDDVAEEVGPDVARYFFLMRRCNSHLDFDLDLAKQASDENPVYYVQYAHARIASILRVARERGADSGDGDVSLLTTEPELTLIRKMLLLPEIVETIARTLEPHHLTYYAQDLATVFHSFYKQCLVVSDDEALTRARLKLVKAAKTVLGRTLHLMGMTAPERM